MANQEEKGVCLICLKHFKKLDYNASHCGYQVRMLADTCKYVGQLVNSDLYTRFLNFVSGYLKLPVIAKVLLRGVKENGVLPFCGNCQGMVSHVCDLYVELSVVKLNLEWNMEKLEGLIKGGGDGFEGVMRDLVVQLNVKSSNAVSTFRGSLARRLRSRSGHLPKVVVPRGLLLGECKFPQDLARKGLMVLIVVFALANYLNEEGLKGYLSQLLSLLESTSKPAATAPKIATEKCSGRPKKLKVKGDSVEKKEDGVEKPRRSRGRPRKVIIPVVKEDESQIQLSEVENEHGTEEKVENDSAQEKAIEHFDCAGSDGGIEDIQHDSDWSKATSPSPLREESDEGSEIEFSVKQNEIPAFKRWNFRSRKLTTKGETEEAYNNEAHSRSDSNISKTAAEKTLKNDSDGISDLDMTEKPFLCKAYNITYGNSCKLVDHFQTVHETDVNVKNYYCPFCYRSFTSQEYLEYHRTQGKMDKCHKKIGCEMCNTKFDTVQELREHLNSHLIKAEVDDSQVAEHSQLQVTQPVSEQLKQVELFTCSKCQWSFLDKRYLEVHKIVHTPYQKKKGIYGYLCPLCPKLLKYTQDLVSHYNIRHGPNIKLHKCETCGATFSHPLSYEQHLKRHKTLTDSEHVCKLCNLKFLTSRTLAWHNKCKHSETKVLTHNLLIRDRKVVKNSGTRAKRLFRDCIGKKKIRKVKVKRKYTIRKPETCELCGDSYKNRFLHLLQHETEEKTIPCCFCDKSFTLRETYEAHLNTYPDGHKWIYKKFVCEDIQCNEVFETHTDLNEHLKTHLSVNDSSNQNYPEKRIRYCKFCNWGFPKPELLQLHQLVHTKRDEETMRYQCPGCSKTSKSRHDLQRHYNWTHMAPVLRPWNCFDCQFLIFSDSESKMINHNKKYHPERLHPEYKNPRLKQRPGYSRNRDTRVGCPKCNIFCATPERLKIHMKRHDPDEHHFMCSNCGEKFNDQVNLDRHMNRKHGIGDTYPCPICGKRFIEPSYVTSHMKIHTTPKFVCGTCGMKLKRRNTYEQHLRTHDATRTPAYICTHCGKGFLVESGLYFHIGTEHTPESEWLHVCVHCSKRFFRRQLLRFHYKTHEKQEGLPIPPEYNDPPKKKKRTEEAAKKNDQGTSVE